MMYKPTLLTAAIALALAVPALAQQGQQTAKTLDNVIVTGTRVTDRTLAESQSPIDIISREALQATGTTELATALARALPSLNFPRPALVDGTSGVRPAQLRGLSPDQVLVLVNGKRYHSSAALNLNGSIGRGSSAVDLNSIPVASIERVEVLRDGASAQYGSDAIAGVINIVLKGAGKGGSLAVNYGEYSKGDGAQFQLSGDTGVQFADGRGTLHVAGQAGYQDPTNRSGAYAGTTPNTGNFPGWARRPSSSAIRRWTPARPRPAPASISPTTSPVTPRPSPATVTSIRMRSIAPGTTTTRPRCWPCITRTATCR